jgi:PAS domain S-box-containing protein
MRSVTAAAFGDTAGRITEVNDAFVALFGYDAASDIVGRHSSELVADRPKYEIFMAQLASGVGCSGELELKRRDGSTFRAVLSATPLTNSQGVPIELMATFVDVSEHRAAEARLREGEAAVARQTRVLEETQRAARMGGWEYDYERREIYWTTGMYRVFETTPEAHSPGEDDLRDRLTPESRALLTSAIRNGGRAFDLDLDIFTFRDRPVKVRVLGLVEHEEGRIRRIFGALQDVTDQRRIEEQIRQAQKMEAIGRLSGGVAHDFNNLLTIIGGNAEIVRDALDDQTGLDAVREIQEAVGRATSLTSQLLTFGRRQTFQPRPLDLNEQVDSVTRMLRRIIGEDIHLELAFAPEPLPVQADPGMIDQILMNLAVNARDAMPSGGRLTIATASVGLDADVTTRMPRGRPGRFATLTVSDTGHGIQPAILPRIFEPFFTTKDVGKGTGLGLATVYGIVEQHRGWTTVASEVDRGTTFRIHFPLARQAEIPAGGRPPEFKSVAGGTETVLLVEDEAAVRDLELRVLTRLGYQVLDAASGPAALALWAGRAADIDLLITDLVMPDGIDGVELARRLMQDKPALRVLFTSGYSADVANAGSPLQPGVDFIAKPFNLIAFARAVRTTLDARRGRQNVQAAPAVSPDLGAT